MKFIRLKDATEKYGIGKKALLNAIKRQALPAYQPGRVILLDEEELIEFVRSSLKKPPVKKGRPRTNSHSRV